MEAPDTLLVRYRIEYRVGDDVRALEQLNGVPMGEARITAIEYLTYQDEDAMRLTLDQPIADLTGSGTSRSWRRGDRDQGEGLYFNTLLNLNTRASGFVVRRFSTHYYNGFRVRGVDGLIEDCEFVHAKGDAILMGQELVWGSPVNTENVTIRNNQFIGNYHIPSRLIQLPEYKASDILLRNTNATSDGLTTEQSNTDITIAGNHFEGYAVEQSILISGAQHVTIENNTFVDPHPDFPDVEEITVGPHTSDIIIRNNTVPPVKVAALVLDPPEIGNPGESATLTVLLRNDIDTVHSGEVVLDMPAGWQLTPSPLSFNVPAGAEKEYAVQITAPTDAQRNQNYPLTASIDGSNTRRLDVAIATLDTIVDHTSADYSESGTWNDSASLMGYKGESLTRHSTQIGATATWTPDLPLSDLYEVAVWYPEADNSALEARYIVSGSSGTTELVVNQQQDAGTWRNLGTFEFSAGTGGHVQLVVETREIPGGFHRANAVRFRPLETTS